MRSFDSDVHEILDARGRLDHHVHGGPGGDPLALPVLVINRVFQPVRITTVRRAIRLVFTGSAEILGDDGELHDFARWRELPVRDGVDDGIAVISGSVRVPRVVHLRRYARERRPTIRLTRRNLLLRDRYQCQYCGDTPTIGGLDIDHVMPRSRGGGDTWHNLVTACLACNRKKGQRTPAEAGMPLQNHPVAPRWSFAVQLLAGASGSYKEWQPFLEAG